MALSSSSSNSWILSLKLLLITSAVIFISITTKLTIPLIVNFAVNDLPVVWSVTISLLKPPFLYVIINVIIIIIVISTHFQHNNQNNDTPHDHVDVDLHINAPNIRPVNFIINDNDIERTVTVEPPVVFETKRILNIIDDETVDVGRYDDELVTSTSTWHSSSESEINSSQLTNKIEPEINFPIREKQLVSSRFVNNRKPPAKTTPQGTRALRVLKPKKHETLESTWKMITEGRHMPLNRHLNKSDTFKTIKNDHSNEFTSAAKVVKKSETFKDRANYENENQYLRTNLSPEGSIGKLKRDGSDELNRRVEAFIKKFNDDMKLQRQESLNQYTEMVNRGVHK